MPTAQINLKIDPQLKKKSQAVAKQLGFNLSNILRAFLINFSRDQKINFSLENNKPVRSSKTLAKELIAAGYSKKYAEEHGRAFEELLKAEKSSSLTRW